jgi:predicted Zn-dependent protease
MEEGLVQARRAIQLDPGRPKTRFVLGQILLAMDRKEEAEFHLKRAAEEISGARKLLAKYFGK